MSIGSTRGEHWPLGGAQDPVVTPRCCIGFTGQPVPTVMNFATWTNITDGGSASAWAITRGHIGAQWPATVPTVTIGWSGLYRVILNTTWSNPNAVDLTIQHRILQNAVGMQGSLGAQGLAALAVAPQYMGVSSATLVQCASGDTLVPQAQLFGWVPGPGGYNMTCVDFNLVVEYVHVG